MRFALPVLVLAALALTLAAQAAPYGPLAAGTAAGAAASAKLCTVYTLGLHYPFGASELRGYPSLPGGSPANHTFAYDEWPDPAAVAGHRTKMSSEIVTVCSKRRGTPQTNRTESDE